MFRYRILDSSGNELNKSTHVVWGDGNVKYFCPRDRTWSIPRNATKIELYTEEYDTEEPIIYNCKHKDAKDVLESIRGQITEEEYQILKRTVR